MSDEPSNSDISPSTVNPSSPPPGEGKKLTRAEARRLQQQQESEAEMKALEERERAAGKLVADRPALAAGIGEAGYTSAESVADLYSLTFEAANAGDNERSILANHFNCRIQGKELFRDTSVNFVAGSRYGLMGPNGRGKSSLLRLMEQRKLPIGRRLLVQLVEQEQEVMEMDTPAFEVVLQSDKTRQRLLEEEKALSELENPTNEEFERLQEVQNELSLLGTDGAEAKVRRILYGLGFPTEWQDWPTKRFSGGWRKRITLACAVFMEPDFLMLDEPTNHLDLNAVMWLQSYLPKVFNSSRKNPKTLVVVSHDVEFLDSVCTHMVHIEDFKLSYYSGGYYDFLNALFAKRKEYDNKYEKVRKDIRVMKRNQHLSKDAIKKVFENRARKEGRDLHDVLLEKRKDYVVNFPFEEPPQLRDPYCLIKLSYLSFGYPGCENLYNNIDIALWSDSRICIVGPNGIGKSTLFGLMDGLLTPTEGHVEIVRNCRVGRYNQHFVDKLPLTATSVELMMSLGFVHEHEARQRLGSFGLEGTAHHQKIETLSGGQKARCALAAISTQRPHLLMLDEPTNHLDMESINALIEAINDYKGGVVVVTHDARLILDTSMSLWLVADKSIRPFDGDLDDYREHVMSVLKAEEDRREAEREAKRTGRVAAQETAKGEKKEPSTAPPIDPEKQAASLTDMFAKKDAKKKKDASVVKEKKEKKDDKK